MKNKVKNNLSKWDKITIGISILITVMLVMFFVLFMTSSLFFFEFALFNFIFMLAGMIYYLFCDKLGVRKLLKTVLISAISISFIVICFSCINLFFFD